MKNFTLITSIILLTASCVSWKTSDFSKRKYLNLHSKEHYNEEVEISEHINIPGKDDTEIIAENSGEEQLVEEVTENFFASSNNHQHEEIIIRETTPVFREIDFDDSLTLSGEDPLVYAIKDQVKIMEPYFKWSKVLLVCSLILAVALVILFFTIDVFSPLGELLYVLLIFKGLFSVIGITSAIWSRIAAKKLKGLSKDEIQIERANKVRSATSWVLLFFLLVPVAGLLGLVIYNNV